MVTLDRRLKRLEASLTPAVQQGITLMLISAATGEIIDLESPNPYDSPTSGQSSRSEVGGDNACCFASTVNIRNKNTRARQV
jgi:hypothetical protein